MFLVYSANEKNTSPMEVERAYFALKRAYFVLKTQTFDDII